MLLVSTMLWAMAGIGQAAPDAEDAQARELIGLGAAAFRNGDFAAATRHWSQAVALCRIAADPALEAEALARRGEAYRVEGLYRDAAADLTAALARAEAAGDARLIASASGALGNLAFMSRRSATAEPLLRRANAMARELGDARLVAASTNDLGNLLAAGGHLAEATQSYAEALAAAELAGETALAATVEINAARLAVEQGAMSRAVTMLDDAVDRLERLPQGYQTGLAFASVGAVALAAKAAPLPALLAIARRAFTSAAAIGVMSAKPALESIALGGQGELDERVGDLATAGRLTEAALFKAQQAGAADLSFRWDWQQARIARAGGHDDAAIALYRRAVATLRVVRQDIPIEYIGGRSSFRTTFEPLYLQFVDLLLRRTSRAGAGAPELMREARGALESLKESELQDYFRDACVTNFEAKRRSVETITPGTAVIYPVVLPDRLELLVSFGTEIRQFTVPVAEARLRADVHDLRLALERRSTYEFLDPARRVYDLVIAPVDRLLAARGVTTLVVVPDSVLRTIPLAALHDGSRFLIERYAIAVVPGLTLVDPQPLAYAARRTLAAGLSLARNGLPPLPEVPNELAAALGPRGGTSLLDQSFLRSRLEQELAGAAYGVVHIASHGQFGGDPSQSYVMAYDGAVTMDELESAIKLTGYREQALELLTLSACETASGDDRATLGLAGLALKAGARSAVATLWFINDRASGTLVELFYRALANRNLSKAQALQAAQRAMLNDPVLRHPAYWAPFLLIGNWL